MKKSPNMSGRPKQPKCPWCGKALYKSLTSQPVKKEWPYAYCRNESCQYHGDIREHVKEVPKQAKRAKKANKPSKALKGRSPATKTSPNAEYKGKKKAAKGVKEGNPWPLDKMMPRPLCEKCGRVECICTNKRKNVEADIVLKTREQIKNVIDQNKSVIGLMLALLIQELGNNDVANQFIDEYDLTTKFGILKKGDTK